MCTLKWSATYLLLILAFFGSSVALAEAAGACPDPPFGGPGFVIVRPTVPEAMSDAQLNDFKMKIAIINGSPARPQDWPATYILCTADGKFCTNTAVGIRVVLTAAHCFDRIRSGSVQIDGIFQPDRSKPPVHVSCTIHPNYVPFNEGEYEADGKKMKREWSADVAVCKADSDLPLQWVEKVAAEKSPLKQGSRLILLGYGCTLPHGGGEVHTLYIGPTTVVEIQEGSYFIRTSNGAAGQAVVCDGDSGGASYTSDKFPRAVNGINSLTDKVSDSWVTDLTRPDIRNFIRDQSDGVPGQVCGLQPDATHCRPI
jgi:hypothetical protein